MIVLDYGIKVYFRQIHEHLIILEASTESRGFCTMYSQPEIMI